MKLRGSVNLFRQGERRRGVVAVKLALLMPILIGFTALAVDVGLVYNAQRELERSVDASAVAGASALSKTMAGQGYGPATDAALAAALANPVAKEPLHIAPQDVHFGWSEANTAGIYDFTENAPLVNAVQVIGRRTEENAEDGPIDLIFAAIFGYRTRNITSQATALMQPRDIAIVADISGSHNDDSELRRVHMLDINLGEVWAALPGGADDAGNTWHANWNNVNEVANGWGWGFFQRDPTGQSHGLGFGYDVSGEPGPTYQMDAVTYEPNSDNGLVHLPLGFAPGGAPVALHWTPDPGTQYAEVKDYLVSLGYKGSFGDPLPGEPLSEINGIMKDLVVGSPANIRRQNWVYRAAVATGYAEWNSGIVSSDNSSPWEVNGWPPAPGAGYGDHKIDANEVRWGKAQFNGRTPMQMGVMWADFCQSSVMQDDSTAVSEGDADFKWKFGLKTFTNYLLERRARFLQTPELAATHHQPMWAEKEAVETLALALSQEYDDLMSLEVYATTVHHEVDLTDMVLDVPARLYELQASHYDGFTNIGGGIRQGRLTLTGPGSRPNANKVIVLVTDGKATAWDTLIPPGPGGALSGNPNPAFSPADLSTARDYARQQATWAHDAGIQIFAVSVGVTADVDLMREIAEITNGRHFHAGCMPGETGCSIDAYTEELQDIFLQIAVIRPVTLIQ